jgi:hypothetical protein
MFDVLLGTVLGMGLVLAFQELRRQYNAFNQRRWIARANSAIALLDACDCWGEPHASSCPAAPEEPTRKFRSIRHP